MLGIMYLQTRKQFEYSSFRARINQRHPRVTAFENRSQQARSIHPIPGWSGGAMALGKIPVPGRPTIWMIVGQGPIALAVGVGGVVWTFLLSSILSLLILPLFGRRPDID